MTNGEQNLKGLKLEECHLHLLYKHCIEYLHWYNSRSGGYQQIKGAFILKC